MRFKQCDTGQQTEFFVEGVDRRDAGGDAILDIEHITFLHIAPSVDFAVNSLWNVSQVGEVKSPMLDVLRRDVLEITGSRLLLWREVRAVLNTGTNLVHPGPSPTVG